MDCGNCTLCCELPPLAEIGKKAGELCIYCEEGCNRYETRPEPCKEFECAYYQVEVANEALRPDRCGVMFEKIEESLMVGTIDPKAGEYPHLNGQISAFLSQGINVVLLKNGQPTVYHTDDSEPDEILSWVYKLAGA